MSCEQTEFYFFLYKDIHLNKDSSKVHQSTLSTIVSKYININIQSLTICMIVIKNSSGNKCHCA